MHNMEDSSLVCWNNPTAMSALPTGEATFLFTDIQGSTRLWEAHPAQMSVALARHDAILRAAIESRQGHVFKTVGDAFCAVFAEPLDGVLAAAEGQRGITTELGVP